MCYCQSPEWVYVAMQKCLLGAEQNRAGEETQQLCKRTLSTGFHLIPIYTVDPVSAEGI